jgi:NAD(P)-dependent dehydrogenase (short-subunit alcohol dehydrogenase family)
MLRRGGRRRERPPPGSKAAWRYSRARSGQVIDETDDSERSAAFTPHMTALLDSRNIIIYGAGGGLGRGIARTFAREGANLYLAGRTIERLEAVAATIAEDGGHAEVAVVDALDEQAVREHAAGVAERAGSLDVSFNLISRGDVHGTPLLDISLADYMAPLTNGMTSHFITAQNAARIMVQQDRGGVILSLTSGSSRIQGPAMGGTGSADAAMESFMRNLAAEVGPRGVRVVGLYTAGVPETFGLEHDSNPNRPSAMSPEDIERIMGPMTMLKHAPRLQEVADAAAFLASDRAAGITATITNVTCGLVT